VPLVATRGKGHYPSSTLSFLISVVFVVLVIYHVVVKAIKKIYLPTKRLLFQMLGGILLFQCIWVYFVKCHEDLRFYE